MNSHDVNAGIAAAPALRSDRFEVRRRIGQGGFGVVFEAFDRERGELVALKTLRVMDAESLYRFKREFRALADVTHPNLVALQELFADGDTWFFSMELVRGVDFLSFVTHGDDASIDDSSPTETSLDGSLSSSSSSSSPMRARARILPFDEPRLRQSLTQLVDGVAALHAAGKLHRDIKPQNVLVTPAGHVKILDFGLVAETGDQSAERAGTPAYIAPEQIKDEALTPASDWYSVGCMLYQALTGVAPFVGTSGKALLIEKLMDEPQRASTMASGLPTDLEELTTSLLRLAPQDRPRGADIATRFGSGAHAHAAVSAPFVGRDDQLSLLRDAFAASRRAPVTVLVQGESGIGKTALVRQFIDDVDGTGCVVLAGRCFERESVPYNALDGVIDALSRHLRRAGDAEAIRSLPSERNTALLARAFPVLLRVPAVQRLDAASTGSTGVDGASPTELRARVFVALRALFARLAEQSAVVLFVDDLQWADADSLVLLEELLRPPDAPRVLIVAASRPLDVALPGDVRRVTVPALSVAESLSLLDGMVQSDESRDVMRGLGDVVSQAIRSRIAHDAAGHPLFLQELTRYTVTSLARALTTASPGGTSTTAGLDEALAERIAELPDAERRLLAVSALAGAPLSVSVIAAASSLSIADCVRTATSLRAAHLLRAVPRARARHGNKGGSDALEPYHDRVRDAVARRCSLDESAAHHTRIAAALEAAGAGDDDPQALIRHLAAAGQGARAATFAERAGQRAQAALAFDQAAAFFDDALRLAGHAPASVDARRVQALRARALEYAGRGMEAADAFIASADGADDDARVPALADAALQLIGSGAVPRGHEVLRLVLREIGEEWPRTPLRALASYLAARARLRIRGLSYVARARTTIDARTQLRMRMNANLAILFIGVDAMRGRALQTRSLLQALDAGDEEYIAQAIAGEAALVAAGGVARLADARALLHKALAIVPKPDALLRATFAGWEQFMYALAGDLRASADKGALAESIFRDETTNHALRLSMVRAGRLYAHRCLASLGEIMRCYDGYLDDAARRGDRYLQVTLPVNANIRWLAKDDVTTARRVLDDARAHLAHIPYDHPHFLAVIAALEIDLYEGRASLERTLEGVRPLRGSQLRHVQLNRVESAWAVARAALATKNIDVASRIARAIDREGSQHALVRARLVDGGVHAQRDDVESALRAFREAAVLADAGGMTGIAAIARRRCGVLVGGEEGAAALQRADDVLRADGIVDPARIMNIYAP